MNTTNQNQENEDVNNETNLSEFVLNFRDCLVQSLDDAKIEGKSRSKTGLNQLFEFDYNRILELQTKGAGIFLAINPTIDDKRQIDSLKHISAVMLDLDVCKEEDKKDKGYIEQKKVDLQKDITKKISEKPHFIIETKNGLQAIWLCNPYNGYGSLREANEMYKGLVKGLSDKIGTPSEGDNAIRLFRLPFTKHQKTLNDPFEVKLIQNNSDLAFYSFEELLLIHGSKSQLKSNTTVSFPVTSILGKSKNPKLCDIPLETIIKDVGKVAGITITFKDQANGTKTIIEDGNETSGFINEAGGSCHSMSGKSRKGKAVGVVKYYLDCNRSKAKKWLYKKYNAELFYSATDLAKDILSNFNLSQFSKVYFECKNSVWSEVKPEYIKDLIINEMEEQGLYHNQARLTEVFRYLDIHAYTGHGCKLHESIKSGIKKGDEIAFLNCIVNVDTWKQRNCKPEDYIVTRIPFKYQERSFSCPQWLKFLNSTFEGKKDKIEIINFLQEWMGYTLLHDTSLEKALIFVGEGANGKSVLLHIWGGVVGSDNCSHIDLGDINNEQYTVQLLGKNLNIAADMRSENQFDTGILKKLVSGDIISGKSVYKEPIEFTNYSRLVFATNNLPYLKDGGTSIQRRLYILQFENVFRGDKKDIKLKPKLEEEVEDILLWAIEGLKRLRTRGGFNPPRSVETAVADYLHESDNLALFLEDHYEITMDNDHKDVERPVLYSQYRGYCNTNGYRAISNRKVYERLRIRGISEKKSSGKRYLIGIRAIDVDPVQEGIDFSPTDNEVL